MNLRRLIALTAKEWREIRRDRVFLALAFLMPITWMFMLGYGISFDVENLQFAVLDQDRTSLSREYVNRFTQSRYFSYRGHLNRPQEIDQHMVLGDLRAVIVIPEHFEESLLAGRAAEIQTVLDGTFANRAQVVLGYVEAISLAFATDVQTQYASQRLGLTPTQAAVLAQPVRIEVRYLYNQQLRSIWSVAPAVLMAVMMLTPPLLTALSVVREKESGSIYNIYASTATRAEFLLGKLLPCLGISIVNALVLWLVAVAFFGAPFKGSVPFFLVAIVAYVLCTCSVGLLISTIARTQPAAVIMAVVFSLVPVIQYSGMFAPVSSLSGVAYVLAHLFPPNYFLTLALGSFLKGVGWAVLWRELAVLAFYAVALLSLSWLLFSKRPRQ